MAVGAAARPPLSGAGDDSVRWDANATAPTSGPMVVKPPPKDEGISDPNATCTGCKIGWGCWVFLWRFLWLHCYIVKGLFFPPR